MIYLELLLSFLKIGALSFGGGLGMISLIRDECLGHGWLTETELLNLVGVAESTPGPIAVNIATFVGASQAGFFGGLLATVGVVLPSFIIITLVAAFFGNLLKKRAVRATLNGMRPAIVGLIVGMSFILILNLLFGVTTSVSEFKFDYFGAIILALVSVGAYLYKKFRKKPISPIILIVFSGILGALFYGI